MEHNGFIFNRNHLATHAPFGRPAAKTRINDDFLPALDEQVFGGNDFANSAIRHMSYGDDIIVVIACRTRKIPIK
jgi:hypothetical protein